MKNAAILISALLLASCAMPATTVRSVDNRPSISVSHVSEQAELFVDGIRMGLAVDFQEPKQLKLEAGTHRIAISEAGRTVFEQTIFIESEHKTIIAK